MARTSRFNRAEVLEVAEKWVSSSLEQDDSLFTPGEGIWSVSVLEELHRRFVQQPDESSDSFLVKLERQMASGPHEALQLMAEVLFVHFLVALPTSVSGDKKREIIKSVLAWTKPVIHIPDTLDSVLNFGICSPGVAFNTFRPEQLRFLIEFSLEWKRLAENDRISLLKDPWAFKAFAFNVPIHKAFVQREAILYLVFPDTFEDIVARDAKKRIVKAFDHMVTEPTDDVDRALLQIRQRIADDHGSDFTFYDPEIARRWQVDTSAWGKFVGWAERFYSWNQFDHEERIYKLEIADRFAAARDALLAGSANWLDLLSRAFGPPNNLVNYRTSMQFLAWVKEHPDVARDALQRLWFDREHLSDRMRHFFTVIPQDALKGPSNRISVLAVLVMALNATEYPVYRAVPFKRAFKLTGVDTPSKDSNETAIYQHALNFLDKFVKEASERGVELRDPLDAQGLVWMITQSDGYKRLLSEKEQQAFLKYRDTGAYDAEDQEEDVVPEPKDAIEILSQELLLDREFLAEIGRLLEEKGQLIFYGPPGTGKTYVAQRLAEMYAEGKARTQLVQFHPSYAYEDFVEGYRPRVTGGQSGFDLLPGPLKRIALEATKSQGVPHVLIIDEINRANLAKVFGELYFLLEYRNKEVILQYSAEGFSLPQNLWIIGTMNTADRSIALVDTALRRRFFFVPFYPDEAPIKGLLRRWLRKHKPDLEWVADIVDEANNRLGDRHFAIGPSYFLKRDLSEEWVSRIWKHSVLPYIAEHYFGDESKLADFDLQKLRDRARAASLDSSRNASQQMEQ